MRVTCYTNNKQEAERLTATDTTATEARGREEQQQQQQQQLDCCCADFGMLLLFWIFCSGCSCSSSQQYLWIDSGRALGRSLVQFCLDLKKTSEGQTEDDCKRKQPIFEFYDIFLYFGTDNKIMEFVVVMNM
jgi:hypothetical protein